jgi:hypothetical protein
VPQDYSSIAIAVSEATPTSGQDILLAVGAAVRTPSPTMKRHRIDKPYAGFRGLARLSQLGTLFDFFRGATCEFARKLAGFPSELRLVQTYPLYARSASAVRLSRCYGQTVSAMSSPVKNGKDHCYWSIAEKVRTHRGWVQRHLLYLGEINDSKKAAWTKLTEVFDPQSEQTMPLALYPADRQVPDHAAAYGVQVRLSEFVLRRPRQWGACWVGCQLWDQLQLEEFWRQRLPTRAKGPAGVTCCRRWSPTV